MFCSALLCSVLSQVARIVLHTQESMVEQFQSEGVLRPRDAEVLLVETHKDSSRLESEWLHRLWGDNLSVSVQAQTQFGVDGRARAGTSISAYNNSSSERGPAAFL